LLGEKGQFLTCIFAECAGKNRPLLRTLKIVGTEEGGVDKMSSFKQRMDEARGLVKIDLVLRNAKLVNVFSGEIHKTDIGIHQGNFVGIGKFEYAEKELDLCGNYVVPGLIDGHVHIESSLLCPEEFCSLLLSHGVTTAVVDPHEIANVFGSKGIRYILDSVENLPFNTFVALPSCVPATDLETSGACLEAKDLYKFIADPKVIGLGEVMDFLGVIQAKPDMVEKLELPVSFFDGHAPGISPQDLNAYYLAGIHTEHECSTVEEVRERLRRGFHVMLREGSAAKNLLDLLPAVTPKNAGQCLLVTDDRHPIDLIREGSIDHMVRVAIQAGMDPIQVIQMATINAARAINFPRLGAVAPGYQADFVILNDLNKFDIEEVYWRGVRQSKRGERPRFQRICNKELTGSVHLGSWSRTKLRVLANNQRDMTAQVWVIGVQEHSLITSALVRELPVIDGLIQTDQTQGIAKLAVLERHHETGNVGVGFVEGLGLKKGAIASTVAHDSHNLVVVGMSDEEMNLAILTCVEMGGGLCLVDGDQVIGKLSLSIAGLMSDQEAEVVAKTLGELHERAHSLGISETVDPFMTLAFLSLPVIPELKLTDLGLVDVEHFQLIKTVRLSKQNPIYSI
jgi:adenine deaminase